MSQLPAGAEGAAAGVLIWSCTCLAANILLQWLLWTGNERRSCQYYHFLCVKYGFHAAERVYADQNRPDVFIVACVAMLATTSSIIQQIYDIM